MTDLNTNQISELLVRLANLESASAIRKLLARYMEICDDLTPDSPMDELGALFAADAVWEGSGKAYQKTFGEHKGRDAIVAFLRTYAAPDPHFASNAHFLTSEVIEVDGDTATGTWVMLQTPTFANGQSFILAARLALKFKIEDGQWSISNFRTENLLRKRIDGDWREDVAVPTPPLPAS